MTKRVLVVGGGFTGLTAAHRLAASGVTVVVAEKSESLGGLAGGFSLGGHSLEKTYHHLFRSDRDILDLCQELALGDQLEWLPSSIAVHRDGVFHPFATPKDLLAFKPLPFLSRVRLGMVVAFLQRWRSGRSLERSPASQWMRKTCGLAAWQTLWQPLLRGKFSTHAEEVSMAWLWARIHIRANSREAGSSGEKLGYFKSGFACVTTALEARIRANKGVLRTHTPLRRLIRAENSWLADLNGSVEEFDDVVFTGSCRAFANLLLESEVDTKAGYLDQLRSIKYLGAACLVFTYPEPLTEAYWNNMNEPDCPFLVLLTHTRLAPCERYGGRHVHYLGNYHTSEDTVANADSRAVSEAWLSWLARAVKGFDPARIEESHFFRFRDAQHVADVGYASRIPPYQTPYPGLWLANFAQIYPEDRGTNYAVREGNRIARLILETAR
ncbi:MAG: NAD(P)/FAD-dependent oxidoreductase [Opitutaceae bacterium]|nr:NAD(P)/FAD-dependent oxidoreductase [Opitutaceae bacterium]